MSELTSEEKHVLEHSTGWLSREPLFRNHFCAGPGHSDYPTIEALIGRGLMRVARQPSELSGGDFVYAVTASGIEALLSASPLKWRKKQLVLAKVPTGRR